MKSIFARIAQFTQTKRATRQLAEALELGDMDAMGAALAGGADLSKVFREFDEPGMYFRKTYQIRGALELAVHYGLPLEAFVLLVRHGARLPAALNGNHKDGLTLSSAITSMIERVDLEAKTPQPTGTGNRPSRL